MLMISASCSHRKEVSYNINFLHEIKIFKPVFLHEIKIFVVFLRKLLDKSPAKIAPD